MRSELKHYQLLCKMTSSIKRTSGKLFFRHVLSQGRIVAMGMNASTSNQPAFHFTLSYLEFSKRFKTYQSLCISVKLKRDRALHIFR